jgi:hypothetical protein
VLSWIQQKHYYEQTDNFLLSQQNTQYNNQHNYNCERKHTPTLIYSLRLCLDGVRIAYSSEQHYSSNLRAIQTQNIFLRTAGLVANLLNHLFVRIANCGKEK